MSRAGFGGPPAEVEKLARLGLDQAVDYLLEYEKQPDTIPNPEWARPEPDLAEKATLLRNAKEQEKREIFQMEKRKQAQRLPELQHWWLQRMTEGARPLQEKLALFWHGHFATSFLKVRDGYLMWKQNDIFRRNAHGQWPQMLVETAQDPAMLLWLDQARSNKAHPNENFAREVMELFSLGEGHYTEKDITEAARALTGFTMQRFGQDFSYNKTMHDEGEKTFLGATGELDGWAVLRLIAEQPQTDRFMTGKLWRFFAGENPSDELIGALAAEFRQSKQHFKPVLRRMFRSEEFYSDAVVAKQVKSPVQWLVGTVRMLERPLPPAQFCSNMLRLLGQELFLPPNVKGWDGGLSWITTSHLLNRYNFTEYLVLGVSNMPMGGRGAGGGGGAPANMEQFMRQQLSRAEREGPPVKVAKLLSNEERRSQEALIEALQKRFLLAKLTPKQTKILRDYLDSQGKMDEQDILHTIRLLMCTPEFQLT